MGSGSTSPETGVLLLHLPLSHLPVSILLLSLMPLPVNVLGITSRGSGGEEGLSGKGNKGLFEIKRQLLVSSVEGNTKVLYSGTPL